MLHFKSTHSIHTVFVHYVTTKMQVYKQKNGLSDKTMNILQIYLRLENILY